MSDSTWHVLLGAVEDLRERRRQTGKAASDELEALRNLLFRVRSAQTGSFLPLIVEETHAGTMTGRLFVTIGETSEVLGVSVATVKRLIKKGEIPVCKIEGRTMIRTADLGAYAMRLVPTNDKAPHLTDVEYR